MKNEAKKILIVGAKGMLGQELEKLFSADRNYEVIAWDREEIDIASEGDVAAKVGNLRPNIIVNCAAYNAVDDAEDNEYLATKINGLAPGYLAKAAKETDALFVHYSTDYVFGGTKKEGYGEDDAPDPQSVYAWSKLLGEGETMENSEKFYLIRLSRLFGRPAASEAAKKSFVDLMLKLAGERDSLDIIDEEYSSPTYAPDLAGRTKEIIEGKHPYGIYHAANEGACTWYEFAAEAFKIKNINVRTNPVSSDKFPRPAKRPAYSRLINAKLPPSRPWQEALREYLIGN